jgi:hypothetical protein
VFTTEIILSLSNKKLYSKPLRQAVEPRAVTDPRLAYTYALAILKQRWPEAEPIITKYPMWAYCYALYVMKQRWSEAEPVIAKDPEWSYLYARNVMKLNETQAKEWNGMESER